MADVVILKAAADDYTAALRWYAERSIAAAAGFETAISRAIEVIALQPLWYPAGCSSTSSIFFRAVDR